MLEKRQEAETLRESSPPLLHDRQDAAVDAEPDAASIVAELTKVAQLPPSSRPTSAEELWKLLSPELQTVDPAGLFSRPEGLELLKAVQLKTAPPEEGRRTPAEGSTGPSGDVSAQSSPPERYAKPDLEDVFVVTGPLPRDMLLKSFPVQSAAFVHQTTVVDAEESAWQAWQESARQQWADLQERMEEDYSYKKNFAEMAVVVSSAGLNPELESIPQVYEELIRQRGDLDQFNALQREHHESIQSIGANIDDFGKWRVILVAIILVQCLLILAFLGFPGSCMAWVWKGLKFGFVDKRQHKLGPGHPMAFTRPQRAPQ
jgi:hypothetical protein